MNRPQNMFQITGENSLYELERKKFDFICEKKELTEKYIIKMYLLNAFYYLISGNVQISCKTS